MLSLIVEARALLAEWKPLKKEGPFGVATAYEMMHKGKQAKLYQKKVKRSKKWFLDYKGKTYPLPKKASFDHAEGILAKL